MWIDDPWARAQRSDENSRAIHALVDEWTEITNALAALCVELDAGAWASAAQVHASARLGEVERSARDVAAQLWNTAP